MHLNTRVGTPQKPLEPGGHRRPGRPALPARGRLVGLRDAGDRAQRALRRRDGHAVVGVEHDVPRERARAAPAALVARRPPVPAGQQRALHGRRRGAVVARRRRRSPTSCARSTSPARDPQPGRAARQPDDAGRAAELDRQSSPRSAFPTSRLGVMLGFHTTQGSRQRARRAPAVERLVRRGQARGARGEAGRGRSCRSATVWSWGWGVWSMGESDPDKEAAACVWLWTRDAGALRRAEARRRRLRSLARRGAPARRACSAHSARARDPLRSSRQRDAAHRRHGRGAERAPGTARARPGDEPDQLGARRRRSAGRRALVRRQLGALPRGARARGHLALARAGDRRYAGTRAQDPARSLHVAAPTSAADPRLVHELRDRAGPRRRREAGALVARRPHDTASRSRRPRRPSVLTALPGAKPLLIPTTTGFSRVTRRRAGDAARRASRSSLATPAISAALASRSS